MGRESEVRYVQGPRRKRILAYAKSRLDTYATTEHGDAKPPDGKASSEKKRVLETEPRGLTFGVRMTVVAVIVAAVYALISMILILRGAMTLVLVVAMLLLASVAVGINYLYWRPWYRTHRYAPLWFIPRRRWFVVFMVWFVVAIAVIILQLLSVRP
jgi:hypothetical protein